MTFLEYESKFNLNSGNTVKDSKEAMPIIGIKEEHSQPIEPELQNMDVTEEDIDLLEKADAAEDQEVDVEMMNLPYAGNNEREDSMKTKQKKDMRESREHQETHSTEEGTNPGAQATVYSDSAIKIFSYLGTDPSDYPDRFSSVNVIKEYNETSPSNGVLLNDRDISQDMNLTVGDIELLEKADAAEDMEEENQVGQWTSDENIDSNAEDPIGAEERDYSTEFKQVRKTFDSEETLMITEFTEDGMSDLKISEVVGGATFISDITRIVKGTSSKGD